MIKKTYFFRNTFLAGIFAVLPLVVTVYILRLLYRLITSNFMPIIGKFFSIKKIQLPESVMGMITVAIFVLIVFTVGLFIKFYIGRTIFKFVEKTIHSIPVVKTLYGAIRQMLDSFNSSSQSFEKVVLAKFPSSEFYCLGYVIRNTQPLLEKSAQLPPCYNVFVPTAPNPTSGFIAIIPKSECIELPITVDEGVKFILSVGILNFASDEQAYALIKGSPEE